MHRHTTPLGRPLAGPARRLRARVAALALVTLPVACGGSDAEPGAATERPAVGATSGAAAGAQPAVTPPVPAPAGPIDESLAESGEELFTAKGCVACHYVGRDERLVGPDLLGVTGRRSWPWFYAMVTNPDSMVRNDPEARQLFAQFMTPMSRQGLSDGEVQAVWEYLRHEAAEGADDGDRDP